MKEKYYSEGEIFKQGLLKNSDGVAYTSKGNISMIVRLLGFKLIKTKWGMSKCLSESQIKAYNKERLIK